MLDEPFSGILLFKGFDKDGHFHVGTTWQLGTRRRPSIVARWVSITVPVRPEERHCLLLVATDARLRHRRVGIMRSGRMHGGRGAWRRAKVRSHLARDADEVALTWGSHAVVVIEHMFFF